MLYLSTRNTTDCYTAYRALNEAQAPDGGFYVPFRLQKFTDSELLALRAKTPCEAIAQILNLFFGVQLTGWDVECVVGRSPVKLETVNQRLLFVEFWRNPDGSLKYLIFNLYRRMTAKEYPASKTTGWAYIAIEIALLFGLYAATKIIPVQGLDVAVESGNFADITAIEYAKQMGLPINMLVCAANENCGVWDLFAKGDFNTAFDLPKYLECFLFARLGKDAVLRYLDACDKKRIYRADEQELRILCEKVFCSVVSENRVDSIISGMHRANGYVLDPSTAVAYGGLQDYRANGGLKQDTLLLVKQRPVLEKE